jgi:hypothetical protein
VISGVLISDGSDELVLRNAGQNFRLIELDKSDLDHVDRGETSIMPAGQMNALASRQQFLDLVRYLIEIRDGGPERARELEPPPSLIAARPLPEYEKRIDHAGLLRDLDDKSLQRGKEIYHRLCANCHGTHREPGSLPTSRRFAVDAFKNGHDPYAMYQTLTHGFGFMTAQTWLVQTQKYDVIHYVREGYLKKHNPAHYSLVDETYLTKLPVGDSRGPEPSDVDSWTQMDYGPNLVMTLEIGDDATNFAYKGERHSARCGTGWCLAGALLDGLRPRHSARGRRLEWRATH